MTDDNEHSCVLHQTGCDVDKCGDYGDCTAVAAADYYCDCEDGYIFDDVIGTCIMKNTKWTIVKGEEATGNDAESSAVCPDNLSVLRCHTYGVTGSADGVTVSGGTCTARAAHAGDHPIRAIAYCGSISQMPDPCTGDVISSTEYRFVSDQSPSVSCPDGYIMSSCIFWSPWTEYMSDEAKSYLDSIGGVKIEDGVCAVPDCVSGSSGWWCRLTAFCTKLTGDAYMQAACPDCDSVSCEDGFECELNSATGLPFCNEVVPGGCDVDRCGDNGECIEHGQNYTCSCNTGYSFDEVTCVDVDECNEEPCGNGDCQNLNGTYTCECMDGYELTDGTCQDVNECETGLCSESERCSNIDGSYLCDCLDTFYKLDGECVCATGFHAMDGECVDVNECDSNPCGDNQDCTNSVGGYSCDCAQGHEYGPDGVCRAYQLSEDCGLAPSKDTYKAFRGQTINVKLIGTLAYDESYATITWEQDGAVIDPTTAGRKALTGFKVVDFQPENAGNYLGSIFVDKPDEPVKCTVSFTLFLKEGSATIEVSNLENFSEDIEEGAKPFTIQCLLKLSNVKLDNANDPDNVDWYLVVPDGEDVKLQHDEDGDFGINKKGGTYRLYFRDPRRELSGTYRCEFNYEAISVSTEVMINIV